MRIFRGRWRKVALFSLMAIIMVSLPGCLDAGTDSSGSTNLSDSSNPSSSPAAPAILSGLPAGAPTRASLNLDTAVAPMGKSSGVYYEIFVRSFSDSDGDGVGDLQGVTNKLDYLQDLGIKGIWLMPIHPSPSYHGYDVTDYYSVNPQYGSMDDMRKLLDEAHERGIKVIIDLVFNHTSNQHPWFIDSAKGKDSKYRDWYIWAGDTGMSTDEPGAWGQQAWHRMGDSEYLGVFWEGMPDLNMDNPKVREELIRIGQFWLKQGVDGFRLDAAKHVYEDFKSSVNNKDVADKNQAWWQEFRKELDEVSKDAFLVGEVWDSPAVVGPYLDNALNSGFNFDLAKLLVGSARAERASTLASSLNKMYEFFSKQSQGTFVDAPFLTNHDQNRVMSELNGNVNRAKMAASLLLTMPGNPFIYYGEEIGMKGTKPDEHIREPMIWTAGGKSDGQTNWEPSLHKDGVVSVDEQIKDAESLLNHYKKMISWRNEEPVLGDGGMLPFQTGNDSVLTFLRVRNETKVLAAHNLSGEPQKVDISVYENISFSKVVLSSKDGVHLQDGQLVLPPYSSAIVK
ncbi:alpha-amylase family glycosyl hydrolase [Paenibacillus caui]|uniref:alpha-amylase family glycosyl hydrolase n=1 Tax=Paenibacillus caui TaxID=2873927 RepID=UPI001F007EB3|nr:alpha-amylase family glycosyl hydrolase [Paenibacillus caui]